MTQNPPQRPLEPAQFQTPQSTGIDRKRSQPQRRGRPVVTPYSCPTWRRRSPVSPSSSVGKGPAPTRVVYALATPITRVTAPGPQPSPVSAPHFPTQNQRFAAGGEVLSRYLRSSENEPAYLLPRWCDLPLVLFSYLTLQLIGRRLILQDNGRLECGYSLCRF